MMVRTAQLGATGPQYAQIGVQTGGDIAAALAPAAAVPIIGAGVVAVGAALALIFGRKGPQQKIEASKIADEAEQQLKANLDAYMAGPRTKSSQAGALANVDYCFAQLREIWSDPALGEPGQRAIAERLDRSSCKWRDTQGACWNWVIGYRDPIANDPDVREDAAAALDQAESVLSGFPAWAWAAVGMVLLGVTL